MRLSRLFGGGKAEEPEKPEDAAPPDAESDNGHPEVDEDDNFDGIPEGDPNADHDAEWRSRAADVIPGGASTGSKRPAALYGEASTTGPTHFVRANGCTIVTPGDLTLIACTMALGSVAIG